MSHLKQRKEKNCLNCNAIVEDKFCGVCGQQNVETKESLWHLINHFFQDITHFDGKFFSSLKYLILKPGFLSAEYVRGRRQAYLNPIRFYVFTSFIFFLILLGLVKTGNEEYKNENTNISDTSLTNKTKIDTSTIIVRVGDEKIKTKKGSFYFSKYKSKEEFDSLIKFKKINPNFIKKSFTYKQLLLRNKYNSDSEKLDELILEKFLHNLPLLFLFSLPFVAMFLKLIYIRNKKFYFVSHGIFTIHLYIFTYIGILLSIGCTHIFDTLNIVLFEYLSNLIFLFILLYWYKAFRKFYQQSRIKTIVKLILTSIWVLFILVALNTFLLFFTVYTL